MILWFSIVKRKQLEIDLERKKEKTKRGKLILEKDLSVVKGLKAAHVSSSSVIKIFHYFIMCFFPLYIKSFV